MAASLGALLERDTLSEWAEQCSVLECAELYDQLREGLTEAQRLYQDAKFRHDHGGAAAAVAESSDLTALLSVIVDALAWRRSVYVGAGRPWPLSRVMI